MSTEELYRVIEEVVKSLPKKQRDWVDDNWRSIVEAWADELVTLASEVEPDEEETPAEPDGDGSDDE
jgi:hypothetical protein